MVGLTTDHHQCRGTLCAQGEEDHDRHRHRNGIDRTAVRPRRRFQSRLQTLTVFIDIPAQTVNGPQCRHNHLTCRKRREHSDSDSPIPTEWFDHRFDPFPESAQVTVGQQAFRDLIPGFKQLMQWLQLCVEFRELRVEFRELRREGFDGCGGLCGRLNRYRLIL